MKDFKNHKISELFIYFFLFEFSFFFFIHDQDRNFMWQISR